MTKLYVLVDSFVGDMISKLRAEEGQTAVEYALVLALVAIVLALALGTGLGGALTNVINAITNALNITSIT
jgi:Flp pilus assembly pilin Flp